MRWLAVLALAILVPAPRASRAAAAEPQLSDDEAQFCENEIDVVERRRKIFESQGLSPAEVQRKNEEALAGLAECRQRLRMQHRRAQEQRQDLEEVARRAGPNATEKEREAAWREIRRERLASRSPSSLTAEEKAELAAGMDEELAATHAALDSAHARDPAFMRVVHSALACYHGDRRDELKGQISTEEALLKVGTGDKQKLYALKSELRQSEDVLERSSEAARGFAGGLERCGSPTVGVVAHCLAIRFQGRRSEPACDAEEIQQYVRFVK